MYPPGRFLTSFSIASISLLCLSSGVTLSCGVMSPTMHSAMSWTADTIMAPPFKMSRLLSAG